MKLVCAQIEVSQFNSQLNYDRMKQVIESNRHADLIIFPAHLVSETYIDRILELRSPSTIVWKDDKSFVYVVQNNQLICHAFDYGSDVTDSKEMHDLSSFTFEVGDYQLGFYHGQFKIRSAFSPFEEDDIESVDIYVNGVGLIDSLERVSVCVGGSYFRGKEYFNNKGEEEVSLIELNKFNIEDRRSDQPLLDAVLAGIRYFDKVTLPFKPNWIVGVSGGLDSSVTLALLTLSLGKDRVIGMSMPGEYTNKLTVDHGQMMADSLGIRYLKKPIGPLVESSLSTLAPQYPDVSGLALENIQARIRGHLLMSVASLENGVVSNNGNKVEMALGYATLYGDAIGALGILGDLNKLKVGALAEAINQRMDSEIVPFDLIPNIRGGEVTFGFKPTAELSENQVDPMKWGYHDHLIEMILKDGVNGVLEQFIETKFAGLEVEQYMDFYNMKKNETFVSDFIWLVDQIKRSAFKRIQCPPILVLSKSPLKDSAQSSPVWDDLSHQLIKEIKQGS